MILHGIAKECEVDLFCLAQLNRNAADDPKGPGVTHINGTDALGQLASAVWLLEFVKPDVELGERFDRGKCLLVHGKSRHGQRLDDLTVTVRESILTIDRDHCFVSHDNPNFD